ncbi:MAG: HNH endonuclease [Alphaproteobacteria bacterium]|nr:HNH endonuclease [Alphaproteobacteria bacterium]
MRNAGNSDDAISNILGEKKSWGERYTRLLEIYNRLLEKQNLPFSNRGKFFWELNPTEKGNLNYPDEKEYLNGNEGERKKIYVNRYERDPRLRAKCLKRYGHSCAVCEFSFKTVFGDIGNGFIHVHHIRPLSKLGGKVRKINAIEDLIPVCPNCHAMLHAKEGGVYSIYELKKIIAHEKTHQ